MPPILSFPVTHVDKIVRRTLMSAAGIGAVAIAAAFTLGYPLLAPGVVLGLVLAVLNHRVFQSSALRYIDSEGTIARKPFAGSVMLRLGACTLVAVALLIWVRPMGWGVILGLAAFQATMLFHSVVALIQYQRHEIAHPGGE